MQTARARYLRGGRVRGAAGGSAARHLGHSIDELRRQAARRARVQAPRGPASAAGLAAGARRTWPLRIVRSLIQRARCSRGMGRAVQRACVQDVVLASSRLPPASSPPASAAELTPPLRQPTDLTQ
ncbi:unnamed protein product [Chrysodeixis includens]|uniref:Uncharacterized protein n=1 Tax=Chrysodeixis includens TaxID=689277 RepID=A0A9N8PY32_CHRIL|nr:unnamed protein product [Chrysodeixis includens]